METENAVLMKMARTSLKGKWSLAIGGFFVAFLIVGAFSSYPKAGIISLILEGPILLGLAIFSLAISRNEDTRFEQIFDGFHNFGKALGAYLLMVLFTFLWTLLLIIPGIIAALSYSMTFFILTDNPTLKPMKAIDKSKQIMDGYKWKLFCLYLRFLGWFFLSLLTLGIGFLWFFPYVHVSVAKFYDDIKDKRPTVIAV